MTIKSNAMPRITHGLRLPDGLAGALAAGALLATCLGSGAAALGEADVTLGPGPDSSPRNFASSFAKAGFNSGEISYGISVASGNAVVEAWRQNKSSLTGSPITTSSHSTPRRATNSNGTGSGAAQRKNAAHSSSDWLRESLANG